MKKRLSYLLIAWLLCLSNVMADNIIIDDVTVPKGGTADLPVNFSFTSSTDKVGFTFTLGLPSGISLDGEGTPVYEKGSSISGFNITIVGGNSFAGQPGNTTATISGTEGTLLTLHLIADESLEVGSTHVVNVTKCTFQQKVDGSVKDINIPDFTFNVTIEDGRVVLNETSTKAPKAANGVDVRVLRTINANTWSTICLPFAMSEAQVKAAFGDDVELGDFTGYTATEENDVVVGLSVNFTSVSAIDANHPYIIKVSNKITEFTVDDVTITPADKPKVAFGETVKQGKQTYYYPKDFVGTYVAEYDFYNNAVSYALFLNGGKFYYATENTAHMKAFRAYFDFNDYLPEIETYTNGVAPARAMISFGNDGTTRIANANIQPIRNGHVYSISGQYLGERQNLGRLPKGVYIIDGKKEVVK